MNPLEFDVGKYDLILQTARWITDYNTSSEFESFLINNSAPYNFYYNSTCNEYKIISNNHQFSISKQLYYLNFLHACKYCFCIKTEDFKRIYLNKYCKDSNLFDFLNMVSSKLIFLYINPEDETIIIISSNLKKAWRLNNRTELINELLKSSKLYYIDKIFPNNATCSYDKWLKSTSQSIDNYFNLLTQDFPEEILKTFNIDKISSNNNTNENKITKGENKMNLPANINFEFGPISSNEVAISPYGLAICDENGAYLTYNPATAQTVDVTGFTFDFEGMIYKVPSALAQIAIGDMIVHKNKYMFVTKVKSTSISAIDITQSEVKEIIPITNIFQFNYIIKVVSFLNLGGLGTPSPDQPFGNIMPYLFMSELFKDKNNPAENNNNSMKDLLMINMFCGNGGFMPFGNMFNFNQTPPTPQA